MSLHPADDVIPDDIYGKMKEGWALMQASPRKDHQYIMYDQVWRLLSFEVSHDRCDDL